MIAKCCNCNKDFLVRPYKTKANKNVFCSKRCYWDFKKLDLVGQKFGDIEVLSYDNSDDRRVRKFKCRCICGNSTSVRIDVLRSCTGDLKCRKCCNRMYVGEVSRAYFCNIKIGAKNRSIPFGITQEDIWGKFLEQDRKCAYSGLELSWQDGNYGVRGTASVDRVNSTVGYTRKNIQIIHKDINRIKWSFSQDYLFFICKQISLFDKSFTPILDYKDNIKHGHRWNGFGEISGEYWCRVKESARKRDIKFNISIEYIWALYLNQGGICALSGLPIDFKTKSASLDRIDSSKEYSENNIQWLHKDVNNMKNDFNQDYFISLCQLIRGKIDG